MRTFNYRQIVLDILDTEVVNYLTILHEYKIKQAITSNVRKDIFTKLLESAKIQSIEASNRIEGICTSSERLKKIVIQQVMPHDRSEQEIAGYRDVLNTIHENYEYLPLNANIIMQLNRDLYKYSAFLDGGKFKSVNNSIIEQDEHGNKKVRFQPVDTWQTADAIDAICNEYNLQLGIGELDPLLTIPIFILDFLCVHPFQDGNGRMSRLLTLLLLYRAGYTVGKYISMEKVICDTKQDYYNALQLSSTDWHNATNDYKPFVKYILSVLVAMYRDFDSRVTTVVEQDLNKTERIRKLLANTLGKMTKAEIMEQCPDISQITVQRTLNELVKTNQIIKIGGGRYTQYIYNRDNNKEINK